MAAWILVGWAVVLGAGCGLRLGAGSAAAQGPRGAQGAPVRELDPAAAKREASRVLVTGFGAFDTYRDNPSVHVAQAMSGKHDGVSWVPLTPLPVVYGDAAERALTEARTHDADTVVVLGLFPGIEGVRVETLAENAPRSTLHDEAGLALPGIDAIPGAPTTIEATRAPEAVVAALAADGRLAYTSRDAGGFVCNDVFYRLLYAGREGRGPRRVLLIHVGDNAASDMTLPKQLARAIRAAIRQSPELEDFTDV